MIHAIINPISGAGSDRSTASRRVSMIEEAAARRSLQVHVTVTERSGHARELAARALADAATGVLVWGGDGTFNEAASSLIGSTVPIGLVPAGSGNGLARALGVPREPEPALKIAFDGPVAAIDAGRIANRLFFNVAGIGFDARVAALFNARAAGTRGGWPYVAIGVREGCRYCASEYTVTFAGHSRRHRALLIAFANGREYGLGARIAPDARLDDGLLDVLIAEDRGVIARFWSLKYLASGTPQLAPRVTTARVTAAVVEAPGAIEFHVDGEPAVAHDRLDVEVIPKAILIRGENRA